jgi:hypothetical protein
VNSEITATGCRSARSRSSSWGVMRSAVAAPGRPASDPLPTGALPPLAAAAHPAAEALRTNHACA